MSSLFVRAAWVPLLALTATATYADRAYVSNEDGNTISVIDTEKMDVIATIPVGKRPRGLKLDPNGNRLFVAVSGLPKCPPTTPDEECAKLGRDVKADGIAVVDLAANKLTKVLEGGSDPEQFAFGAEGKRLFVANEDAALASVLDIESGKVVQRIQVGREPEGTVVSPDGRWLLVTNESDNSVSVIDTQALKVVNTLKVGKRPRDAAFTPDSKTAYISGELDASVYRVDIPNGQKIERVLQLRPEAKPMAVILDDKRNRLYVSTGRGGTVAVVDVPGEGKPLKLVKEIQVGTRPWGIALSEDGQRLFSANGPSNDVSVVDTSSLRLIKQIKAGSSPWGVVVGPNPQRSTSPQAR